MNAQLPRITVVTPSFNQGRFLRETIESVLGQGYPGLEYIIVDGGSTDESAAIISEYAPRLAWWVSEPDKGQSDAINKGFQRASGELLCWVNSDDLLLPGCLKAVAEEYLRRGRPELIHTNYVYIDEAGRLIRALRIPPQSGFFMFRGVWSVSVPSSFFSTRLLREVGYLNHSYHQSMDLDLWMRMIKAGGRVVQVPRYLGAFRVHATSKTSMKLEELNGDWYSNPDDLRIFAEHLPQTTQRSRRFWRMMWKLYRAARLDYMFSLLDTIRYWKKPMSVVFPGLRGC